MHHKLFTKDDSTSSILDYNSARVAEFYDLLAQQGHAKETFAAFQNIIWEYYGSNKRSFAWRNTTEPYHIVASEIMLQQTQTDRVTPKFDLFINRFPTFQALASASFESVLAAWKGLGYNRRALALQKIAQTVVTEHQGILPAEPDLLVTWPGLGKATAASITAFAYNLPTVFIETNIRTVFIHLFFSDAADIHDKQLMPLIEKTVCTQNPREWYYALMDYGVMLKKQFKNPSRKSAHYTKQSSFKGSDRRIRGLILEHLLKAPHTAAALTALLAEPEERVTKLIGQLEKEGMIVKTAPHTSGPDSLNDLLYRIS